MSRPRSPVRRDEAVSRRLLLHLRGETDWIRATHRQATEVLGAQQFIELVYRLNSAQDPDTLRILDDVIVLAVYANPDGTELVSNRYYRTDALGRTPEDRDYDGIPVLYGWRATPPFVNDGPGR